MRNPRPEPRDSRAIKTIESLILNLQPIIEHGLSAGTSNEMIESCGSLAKALPPNLKIAGRRWAEGVARFAGRGIAIEAYLLGAAGALSIARGSDPSRLWKKALQIGEGRPGVATAAAFRYGLLTGRQLAARARNTDN